MLKPMLPTLSTEKPKGDNWLYEVKYDGYRCLLHWTNEEIQLISRNGRSLNEQFPEVISFCHSIQPTIQATLPLLCDGEIVQLENSFKSSFEIMQKRGRLRKKETILQMTKEKPCHLLLFDLLTIKGDTITGEPYSIRKKRLKDWFEDNNLNTTKVDTSTTQTLQYINSYPNYEDIWKKVKKHDGEGLLAKQKDSTWEKGKRTQQWLKLKNYKKITCFITGYDTKNGFFHVAVYQHNKEVEIGLFKHGLKETERKVLLDIIRKNEVQTRKEYIEIPAGICVDIKCLELYQGQLREPFFEQFRFDLTAEDCTWDKLLLDLKPIIHEEVTVTNPQKILWSSINWSKQDYLSYLQQVSPYMMPFLKERLLTVIRYPNGIDKEAFYQKNCPDYAPEFVETEQSDDIDYIVTNTIETLLWLGNQAAIEFHIPFQTRYSKGPSEIVFDLDPPSRKEFSYAVRAAQLIKEVVDGLNLSSFVKTSGNKGIQVYLPLPENEFSFDDTRKFTSFVADYLISKEPDLFTTERLKKKRGNRLYIDYIQHGEGKTIISPYSARGNKEALVATPLFWEEVNEDLRPERFPITSILKRIEERGCPLSTYFLEKERQPFKPILEFLSKK
ncbi:DNA ligase D [Bacillus sp. FJAT-45350]|uniref:DNA ligase D n=1 Tax=Bacillus sp. FJAT-45350 TaxID=2011014 RepID=UPI00211CDBF3|nr:DNA ligase D [Bacillus sp. FJAT-45350]